MTGKDGDSTTLAALSDPLDSLPRQLSEVHHGLFQVTPIQNVEEWIFALAAKSAVRWQRKKTAHHSVHFLEDSVPSFLISSCLSQPSGIFLFVKISVKKAYVFLS